MASENSPSYISMIGCKNFFVSVARLFEIAVKIFVGASLPGDLCPLFVPQEANAPVASRRELADAASHLTRRRRTARTGAELCVLATAGEPHAAPCSPRYGAMDATTMCTHSRIHR